MVQYSPELIEKTILIFKSRTDREISEEDARQALENVAGFFRVLQDWAQEDILGNCELFSGCSTKIGGIKH